MNLCLRIYKFIFKFYIVIPVILYCVGWFFGFTAPLWEKVAMWGCHQVENCAKTIEPLEKQLQNQPSQEQVEKMINEKLKGVLEKH